MFYTGKLFVGSLKRSVKQRTSLQPHASNTLESGSSLRYLFAASTEFTLHQSSHPHRFNAHIWWSKNFHGIPTLPHLVIPGRVSKDQCNILLFIICGVYHRIEAHCGWRAFKTNHNLIFKGSLVSIGCPSNSAHMNWCLINKRCLINKTGAL